MSVQGQMLAIGQKILRLARRALLGRGWGCTILIHDARLSPPRIQLAVVTTLPSRRHQRVVTAHALHGMALLDGADADTAGEMATADADAFLAGELDKEES